MEALLRQAYLLPSAKPNECMLGCAGQSFVEQCLATSIASWPLRDHANCPYAAVWPGHNLSSNREFISYPPKLLYSTATARATAAGTKNPLRYGGPIFKLFFLLPCTWKVMGCCDNLTGRPFCTAGPFRPF